LSLCSKPLRQRFQISGAHPQHDLFPMATMHCQDMVFVEDYLIALAKFVSPSLVQRIVYIADQPLPISLRNLDPEILAPAP
jgi:hypothetical protein